MEAVTLANHGSSKACGMSSVVIENRLSLHVIMMLRVQHCSTLLVPYVVMNLCLIAVPYDHHVIRSCMMQVPVGLHSVNNLQVMAVS